MRLLTTLAVVLTVLATTATADEWDPRDDAEAHVVAPVDDAARREAAASAVDVDALDCDEKLRYMKNTVDAEVRRYAQQDAREATQRGLVLVSIIFPPAFIPNLLIGYSDLSTEQLYLLGRRLDISYKEHC